jgi:hypothetical protein
MARVCFNGAMSSPLMPGPMPLPASAPRRRTGLILTLVLVPVILLVAVVVVVISLQAAHSEARWTAVNRNCPTLDASVADTLGMAAAPLADDSSRGALDNSKVRHCYYSPGDDTNTGLQVIVRLYEGGLRHDSHGEALAAVKENPPTNFHPIGPQSGDGSLFGDRGTAATLTLITIPDNAVITLQLYDRDKLGDATEAQALALRAPLQTVADQALANLG